jgi:hypothetical protein
MRSFVFLSPFCGLFYVDLEGRWWTVIEWRVGPVGRRNGEQCGGRRRSWCRGDYG